MEELDKMEVSMEVGKQQEDGPEIPLSDEELEKRSLSWRKIVVKLLGKRANFKPLHQYLCNSKIDQCVY